MLLKSVSYENFLSFKEYGRVEFSVGVPTVILGLNGTGKTNFLTLIRWVLYGDIIFEKEHCAHKLYNRQREHECLLGERFEVKGIIDFEYRNNIYCVSRIHKYIKSFPESRFEGQRLSLICRSVNREDWVVIANPQEAIEQILPYLLSKLIFADEQVPFSLFESNYHYFKKSIFRENEKSFLYSFIDGGIPFLAVKDLGRESDFRSAIGKFYKQICSTSDEQNLRKEILYAKIRLREIASRIELYRREQRDLLEEIIELSEYIGYFSKCVEDSPQNLDYHNQLLELKKLRMHRKDNIQSLNEELSEFQTKECVEKEKIKKLSCKLDVQNHSKEDVLKLDVLEEARNYFSAHLIKRSEEMKMELEQFIQKTIDTIPMRRTVKLKSLFNLHVIDKYGDMSMGHGAFMLVFNIYLVGLVKILEKELGGENVEIPVFVDDAFRYLDSRQRQILDKQLSAVSQVVILCHPSDFTWSGSGKVGNVYEISVDENYNSCLKQRAK